MIYFAQPTEGGPIKIGCSNDAPARLRQFEAHYRCPLSVLATMEGGRDEEAEIHARFASLRLGRTEQFRPAPELIEFMNRPLLVDPNPDAIVAMDGHTRKNVVSIRGTEAWREWLMGLAAHKRLKAADVIDQALIEYAERHGYPKPAPPR